MGKEIEIMQITVYSNPNCVMCEQTKKWLERNGLRFEAKMIEDSPEVQELIAEHKFQSAPVVVAGGKVWSGFRLDHLKDIAHEIASKERS
jgi:glutaredoxin-like protein NrdH